MEIPSTRLRSPRTGKTKTGKTAKTVPTALLLRRKRECDAKALKIVERMMEPEVDVDWLLKSLSHLNRSHMEDVVEERSIVKLCGYALCDNPLTKVVNKQYQISTLRNKVYDVSRVKNYCSYSCYTATEYLMEQMLTSPLWHREQEETPNFHILPKKTKERRSKSPPGVEVDLTGIKLPDETDNCEEKPKNETEDKETRENLENSCLRKEEKKEETPEVKDIRIEAKSEESSQIKEEIATPLTEEALNSVEIKNSESSKIKTEVTIPLKEETNSTKSHHENPLPVSQDIPGPSKSPGKTIEKNVSIASSNSLQSRKTERRKARESRKKPISFDTLTARVEKSFKEWITDKTICLLHGELSEKQKILESINRQEKYAALCKKLNHLQLEEEREANERIGDLQPAPHFSALQEEAKGLELKVRAFWEGKTTIDRETGKIAESAKKEEPEVDTILPMIDIHAPNALRRRIFLDKLNKVLPDLLRALAISGQSSSAQYSYTSERCAAVKALVSTFSLSATNITFKSPEWTLVALIIIKLLGIMDPGMKYLLGSKQATIHISMILMSYKLDSNYLESLITTLTSPPNTNEEEQDS